jgi:hypothetical protein
MLVSVASGDGGGSGGEAGCVARVGGHVGVGGKEARIMRTRARRGRRGGNTMGDARVRGVLGQGRCWYGDHGAPIDTPADTFLIFLSCA